MTCQELIEFLMDYTAGALPAEQRAEFERHLSLCPSCVAYMKTYESAVRLSRDALDFSEEDLARRAPDDLVKAVLAAKNHPSAGS